MSEQLEPSPVKISYRVTLEIIDKETGREERKVSKDGVLVEHIILKEGATHADA